MRFACYWAPLVHAATSRAARRTQHERVVPDTTHPVLGTICQSVCSVFCDLLSRLSLIVSPPGISMDQTLFLNQSAHSVHVVLTGN